MSPIALAISKRGKIGVLLSSLSALLNLSFFIAGCIFFSKIPTKLPILRAFLGTSITLLLFSASARCYYKEQERKIGVPKNPCYYFALLVPLTCMITVSALGIAISKNLSNGLEKAVFVLSIASLVAYLAVYVYQMLPENKPSVSVNFKSDESSVGEDPATDESYVGEDSASSKSDADRGQVNGESIGMLFGMDETMRDEAPCSELSNGYTYGMFPAELLR